MLLHCGAAAGAGRRRQTGTRGDGAHRAARAGRWDAGAADGAVGPHAPVRSARSTRPAGAQRVRRDQVSTGEPPTVAAAAAKPVARAPPPCLRIKQQRAAAGAYDLTLRRTAACAQGTVGLRSIRPRLVGGAGAHTHPAAPPWCWPPPRRARVVLARGDRPQAAREASPAGACGAAPAPCALRRLAGVAATASRRGARTGLRRLVRLAAAHRQARCAPPADARRHATQLLARPPKRVPRRAAPRRLRPRFWLASLAPRRRTLEATSAR